jgi:energy-converting hydrogenase Eha subunit B
VGSYPAVRLLGWTSVRELNSGVAAGAFMGKKVTFPSGAREKTLRGATQHYLLGGTRLRVGTSVSLRKRKKTESPGQ